MFALILGVYMLMVEGGNTPVAPVAVGVAPALEIIGPTGGIEGDIIILQSKTEGTHISWILASGPVDKEGNKAIILPMEGNTKCLVQSKAGTYIVVCSSSNAEGNIQKVWTITITANHGPNPPPVPPTPIDLNSEYGYVALTYNACKGKDKNTLLKLAADYTKLSDKYRNTNETIDTIAEDERTVNRSNLTLQERTDLSDWAEAKVARDKEFLKTGSYIGSDYAKWMAEIAKGLRLAAGEK